MTARHALVRQRLRVDWRAIGRLLEDIADALWKAAFAAFWSFLAASVFGLLAHGLDQNGQWAAALMTIVIGFALIVYALVVWAWRQTMEKPTTRQGGQSCPWCWRDNVRLTTEVKGHPRPGILTLIDANGIKVCGDCAPTVINKACQEHQFSSPAVEVLPIKTTPMPAPLSAEDRAEIDREIREDRTRDAAGLE